MVQDLGVRLQSLRKGKKLSQKEVSNALGISASVLSNYESGERTPSLENLVSLAGFYRCSTDYLLGFEKYTPEKVIDVSELTDEQIKRLTDFIGSL